MCSGLGRRCACVCVYACSQPCSDDGRSDESPVARPQGLGAGRRRLAASIQARQRMRARAYTHAHAHTAHLVLVLAGGELQGDHPAIALAPLHDCATRAGGGRPYGIYVPSCGRAAQCGSASRQQQVGWTGRRWSPRAGRPLRIASATAVTTHAEHAVHQTAPNLANWRKLAEAGVLTGGPAAVPAAHLGRAAHHLEHLPILELAPRAEGHHRRGRPGALGAGAALPAAAAVHLDLSVSDAHRCRRGAARLADARAGLSRRGGKEPDSGAACAGEGLHCEHARKQPGLRPSSSAGGRGSRRLRAAGRRQLTCPVAAQIPRDESLTRMCAHETGAHARRGRGWARGGHAAMPLSVLLLSAPADARQESGVLKSQIRRSDGPQCLYHRAGQGSAQQYMYCRCSPPFGCFPPNWGSSFPLVSGCWAVG